MIRGWKSGKCRNIEGVRWGRVEMCSRGWRNFYSAGKRDRSAAARPPKRGYVELARASGIERRIIVSNNPGRRFSSVSMATCASRANGCLRRLAIEATPTVGSLPLSLGEFWWGQRSSGGVGGAKVGRRSPAYRRWNRLFRPRAAFASPRRRRRRRRRPSTVPPGPEASAKSFRFYYRS